MRAFRHPAMTTVLAAVLMATLTAAFAAYAVTQVAAIDATRDLTPDELRMGLSPQMAGNATLLVSAIILAVCVLALAATIGVARRRQGARYGAIALFAMLGLLAAAAGVAGVTATPLRPNAWYGVIVALLDASIVVLLLAPSTADEFDRVEFERQWLRTRGTPFVADG